MSSSQADLMLYDVYPETLTLYHRSNVEFSFPSEDVLTDKTNWHNNGALGLWCSTVPNMCKGFGRHCYEVEICDDACWVGWAYNDFYNICKRTESRQDYLLLRDVLLHNGIDVVFIVDASDEINEVIILNYKVISFSKVDSVPEDKRYKLALGRKL